MVKLQKPSERPRWWDLDVQMWQDITVWRLDTLQTFRHRQRCHTMRMQSYEIIDAEYYWRLIKNYRVFMLFYLMACLSPVYYVIVNVVSGRQPFEPTRIAIWDLLALLFR